MYKDFAVLAITLLTIALILAGIRVRKYNLPYLYFLSAVVTSALIFADPSLVGDKLVRYMHPLFVPVLFLIGPGIYGSVLKIEDRRKPWHIIHYLPFIIGYIILLLHWFLDYEHYRYSIETARQLNFLESMTFFPFSDGFILLSYPIYTSGYLVFTLIKLKSLRAEAKQYVLPFALLIHCPIIFDIVHGFVKGYSLIIADFQMQRYFMISIVLVIFWDVVIAKPLNPKKLLEEKSKPEARSFTYPTRHIGYSSPILIAIEDWIIDSKIDLSTLLQSKDFFIHNSSFSKTEWDTFFRDTNTNWNYLKRFIRIGRVLLLIKQGYLDDKSIDLLSTEVGYKSRASLYLAFETICGYSLTEHH